VPARTLCAYFYDNTLNGPLERVEEPTTSGSTGHEADAIAQSIARLRALIAIEKKERPGDWQQLLAPEVAALSVDFSRQQNGAIGLAEIALISLAAAKGSVDAKKRALKPTRWVDEPPPLLSDVLQTVDEARCGIKVLQPIKAPWVATYVLQELQRNKWPGLTAELVAWALKASVDVETFVRALNSVPVSDGPQYVDWITPVLQTTTKLLGKFAVPGGAALTTEAAELAARIERAIAAEAVPQEKAKKQTALATVVGLLAQVARAEAAITLQPSLIIAVQRAKPPGKASGGALAADVESLIRQALSVLSVVAPLVDGITLEQLRAVWAGYRECSGRADQLLRAYIDQHPALSVVAGSGADKERPRVANDAIEIILSNLVANWDDFFANQPEGPALAQIGARIEDVLEHHRIERFGAAGEVVPYDPFKHQLIDSGGEHTTKIEIVKPGLLARRSDGTLRVLVMAVARASESTK
jgi:hypothetical protein